MNSGPGPPDSASNRSESGGGSSSGGGSPESSTGSGVDGSSATLAALPDGSGAGSSFGDGSSADSTPTASSSSSGSGGSSGSSSSGTASSSSGGSSTGSGNSGGADGGSCTPGVSRCSGVSAEQTCEVTERWGTPWACAAGTCSGGACTGSTTAAASCLAGGGPGLTDCGAGGETCCTSLEVTGGTYYRTYDLDPMNLLTLSADGGPTDLADPATVSGFRLDKYLVTVGRFRQFVNAVFPPDGGSGWLPTPGSGKHLHLNGANGLSGTAGGYEPGWSTTDNGHISPTDANLLCDPMSATWTTVAGTQETLPINCVNWYEAYAFCIWDGGFLPSEAEWEYAAAGGSQQREYPWGSTDPGANDEYAIYNYNYMANPTYIAPVGTAALGAGLWGQLDLAGELWEWNLDWSGAYADPCTDCADTTEDTERVVRGMDFGVQGGLYPPFRTNGPPSLRLGPFGFRCARTP